MKKSDSTKFSDAEKEVLGLYSKTVLQILAYKEACLQELLDILDEIDTEAAESLRAQVRLERDLTSAAKAEIYRDIRRIGRE